MEGEGRRALSPLPSAIAMDLFDGPDDFLGDAGGRDPGEKTAALKALAEGSAAEVAGVVAALHDAKDGSLQAEVSLSLLRGQVHRDAAVVDGVLQYLAELGDGRCVRPMEQVLVQASAALTEHQAWRARHIVQKIRRFGRK